MPKAFRHTGVLMMLAVVALGLVGAAYTLWSENLTLETSVTTGSVDVNWSIDPVHPDDGTWTSDEIVGVASGPILPGAVPNFFHLHLDTPGNPLDPPKDKYLQTCEIKRGVDDSTTNPSQHTLIINATDLFPYAGCEFAFDIENTGTVPVHLTQKVAKSVTSSGTVHLNVAPIQVTQSANVDPLEAKAVCTAVLNNWLYADANPLGTPLTWTPTGEASKPIQLHGGDEVNCRVWFYLEQDSTEGASINISSTIIAHQWNEVP